MDQCMSITKTTEGQSKERTNTDIFRLKRVEKGLHREKNIDIENITMEEITQLKIERNLSELILTNGKRLKEIDIERSRYEPIDQMNRDRFGQKQTENK